MWTGPAILSHYGRATVVVIVHSPCRAAGGLLPQV